MLKNFLCFSLNVHVIATIKKKLLDLSIFNIEVKLEIRNVIKVSKIFEKFNTGTIQFEIFCV